MISYSKQELRLGLSFMASIFFIFGFMTNFNIAMKDQVQLAFDLKTLYPGWENFFAQLVNGVFFFAYFCFSLFSGFIIKRIGYKNGVVVGLALVALGSFMFFPAVSMLSYPFFLSAIFVMASGVVFLQTAANPYVVALGPQGTASARLNLTQALNAVATTIAPYIAGILVLAPAVLALNNGASAQVAADFVKVPFVIMSVIVVVIASGILFIRLPEIKSIENVMSVVSIKKTQVWLGAIGIFCYVGAEVGTVSQISIYMNDLLHIAKDEAVKLTAIYWGGNMIGRFLGSVFLNDIAKKTKMKYAMFILVFAFVVGWFIVSAGIKDGHFVFESKPLLGLIFLGIAVLNLILLSLGKGIANVSLGIYATVNMILVLFGIILPPAIGVWCLLSVGFFNSIMFPSIFSLGVQDLDPSEMPIASGIINTMIVGGAVIPVLMGILTDSASLKIALLAPIICYAYIAFFGLKGCKLRQRV
nr:MFS transporter [uncultured Draconibacterium sp.]